ncbi:MAG: hypothetical protein AAF333_09145 [Planctomycetota bacterium]
MRCNINAKGKAVRLVTGLLTLVGAGVLAALIPTLGLSGAWWFAVIGGVVGGGFAVFEGWSGWCALRAMGFKTPL